MNFKNKGFTLVELIVVITITSLLIFSIGKLVDSSKIQKLNNDIRNNLSYSKNFFDTLGTSYFSVNNEINNLYNFNESPDKKINIDFNIPYINIYMTGDVVGNNIVEIEKRNKIFNIENNKNNDGYLNKFVFSDILLDKLKLISNGNIRKIILLNIPNEKFNNIIVENSINSLLQNDYKIYDGNSNLIYSYIYNEQLGKYDEYNNLTSFGVSSYKILDLKSNTDMLNKEINIFNLPILGKNNNCIIYRDINSSYFNDIISENIILNNVFKKNINFKKDNGLKYIDSGIIVNGTNYCDFNHQILLLQNY